MSPPPDKAVHSVLLLILLGIAGCAVTQPRASLGALHVQTIVAVGDDAWFEVVNTSDRVVDLSDYVFVDHQGDLDRAAGFPAISLAPGERYVQHVHRAAQGFQLHSGDRVWIYVAD